MCNLPRRPRADGIAAGLALASLLLALLPGVATAQPGASPPSERASGGRVFLAPLSWQALTLQASGPDSRVREEVDARGYALSVDWYVVDNVALTAGVQTGEVHKVRLTVDPKADADTSPAEIGIAETDEPFATGRMEQLNAGALYAWVYRGWSFQVGGAAFAGHARYHFRDELLTEGHEREAWTVATSGLMFKAATDYTFTNRLIAGVGVDVSVLEQASGSRVDAYEDAGFEVRSARLLAYFLRGGYAF